MFYNWFPEGLKESKMSKSVNDSFPDIGILVLFSCFGLINIFSTIWHLCFEHPIYRYTAIPKLLKSREPVMSYDDPALENIEF